MMENINANTLVNMRFITNVNKILIIEIRFIELIHNEWKTKESQTTKQKNRCNKTGYIQNI